MQVDKRSVLPRGLEVDDARDGAALRLHQGGLFVNQDGLVMRFRLELRVEAPDLPGRQDNVVGLKGLEVICVDLDAVGSGPEERCVVAAARAGGDFAYGELLARFEDDQLDVRNGLSGGVGDCAAQRGRLRLREQQSRRNQEEQKSIEPPNHACLTGWFRCGQERRRQGILLLTAAALELPRGPEFINLNDCQKLRRLRCGKLPPSEP